MQSYLTFALAALTANAIRLQDVPEDLVEDTVALTSGSTTEATAFLKCNIGNGPSEPTIWNGNSFPKRSNNGVSMELGNTLSKDSWTGLQTTFSGMPGKTGDVTNMLCSPINMGNIQDKFLIIIEDNGNDIA